MNLTFFTDQCVPEEIARGLESAGFRVFRLCDYLPIQSPDESVIAKALEFDAVLLSLNGDFADIVSFPPKKFGGNISVQLHNHPEIIPYIMKSLLHFLRDFPEREFYRGKLVIVEAHRVRVRE